MRLHSRSFLVLVAALLVSASADAQTAKNTFVNSAVNVIPSSGPAATYPSTITTAGLTGFSYHVSVNVNISHSYPADVHMLLVSPGNRAVMLAATAGGGSSSAWANTRLDFDDCAPRAMFPANTPTGRYRPTKFGVGVPLPAPAPTAPYGNTLAEFSALSGGALNGQWRLFVFDAAPGDTGQVNSWSLTFFTQPTSPLVEGRVPISCTAPDFDGDGRTDVGIYRDATGEWFIAQSGQNNAVTIIGWGAPSSSGAADTPVAADYDGDGIADAAVYRQSTGVWFVRKSSEVGGIMQVAFGAPASFGLGDTPVPGDYDGDGQADLAIYRVNTGEWFLRPSSGKPTMTFPFGFPPTGDKPIR